MFAKRNNPSMKKFILSGLAATIMAFSAQVMAEEFVAGKDYTVLKKTSVLPKGSVEVREFFSYACPHCYILEPNIQGWLKQKPQNVTFVRTPAAMNSVWEAGARMYYASELLGVRKYTHIPLFHAIQENGQYIFDPESGAQFFSKYGVPESKFKNAYNSFEVNTKVAESNKLAMQYQLTGVPAVVVNGKYMVHGENSRVIQVVNYLVEKEKTAK